MNTSILKKTALASGVALIVSSMAQAQESVEEVLVTGIRASVQASMDVKRESRGVVDSINTEDIGKFPDNNLAESLQRITGVSISRVNGEGSQVTVRGFGADFNMVTLNNRLMPATTLPQNGGGNSTSRAFDMSNIASEAVRAVDVYKTGKANLASGGIGATINIKTARPFDNPGGHASIGAKAIVDTTNRIGDDVTPEVFGLFSWTDDDEKVGFGVNFTHQKRDSGASGAYVNNWRTAAFDGTLPNSPEGADAGRALNIVNAPAIDALRSTASDVRYTHADRERTRTNAEFVLQFRPSDSVTATVDYTFSEQELFENRSELSIWMEDSYKSDVVFDNGAVPAPALQWEERRQNKPRDVGYALQQQNQQNQNNAVGLNVDWEVNDRLSLNFDYHDAKANSRPNDDFGNWINIGLGSNVQRAAGVDFTGDLPIILIDFYDGDFRDSNKEPGDDLSQVSPDRVSYNNNGQIDKGEIGSAVRQIYYDRAETEITQMRLDGAFEINDTSSIDFGIERREMTNSSKTSFYQETLEGGWGVTNPGDVPPELLEPINYGGLFGDYNLASPNIDFFNTESANRSDADFRDPAAARTVRPLLQGFIGDAGAVGEVLSANAGLPWQVNPVDSVDRLVEEDVDSLYVQYDLAAEVGGMPLNILAGLRYEATDVTSTANTANPSGVVWQSNNDFQVPVDPNGERVTVVETHDYDHWLPSLDIDIDFTDSLKGRISYGETIGRQTYEKLGVAASTLTGPSTVTTIPGSQFGTAVAGTAGINPLESQNIDVSVEWYFDDTSYVSLGYFDKTVSNFPGTQVVRQSLYGITDPTNGPRERQARLDLADLGIAVTDTTLFTMVAANQLGVAYDDRSAEQFETDVDVLSSPEDELLLFDVSTPAANIDGNIDGLEFAVQHFFGDTGFGVHANYTMVDTDTEYDVLGDPSSTQFAITGISDSANLILMYEMDNLSARVAYNWRDEYLDSATVNANEPEFIEDYSQLDFNIGYQINDNLAIAFEGLNITEEDSRRHGRTEAQFRRLEIFGARYQLSARYTF